MSSPMRGSNSQRVWSSHPTLAQALASLDSFGVSGPALPGDRPNQVYDNWAGRLESEEASEELYDWMDTDEDGLSERALDPFDEPMVEGDGCEDCGIAKAAENGNDDESWREFAPSDVREEDYNCTRP